MNRARSIFLLSVTYLLVSGVAPAVAQETPELEYDSIRGVYVLTYLDDGSNWRTVEIVPPNRVDPVVELTVEDGPLRNFRYEVTNRSTPESTQALWMIKVDCPDKNQISFEAIPVGWSGKVYKKSERSVCRIMAPHDGAEIQPGETANGFVLSSDRLPAFVTGRAFGLAPEPPALQGVTSLEPEEAILLAEASGTRGGWREFPMVVPSSSPPPADPVDHLGAVRSDLLEVCELGWIDESRVCNSLERKLVGAIDALERDDPAAARDKLESFLAELDAQRGKHVSENAYWLLFLHGEDVLNGL